MRDEKNARFYGNLDIKTLGGAGFASQRTVGEDRSWDLSDYAGIQLNIAKGDSEYLPSRRCVFEGSFRALCETKLTL